MILSYRQLPTLLKIITVFTIERRFGKSFERNRLTVSIILFSTHEVEQSNLIR